MTASVLPWRDAHSALVVAVRLLARCAVLALRTLQVKVRKRLPACLAHHAMVEAECYCGRVSFYDLILFPTDESLRVFARCVILSAHHSCDRCTKCCRVLSTGSNSAQRQAWTRVILKHQREWRWMTSFTADSLSWCVAAEPPSRSCGLAVHVGFAIADIWFR